MDNKLFKKLNFKTQGYILACNYPDSFVPDLEAMRAYAEILTDSASLESIEFAIAFGKTQEEVDELTHAITPKLGDDPVFWFCYPKQSSKKYTCEFNRDTGWSVMGEYGLEPVRQVAIDEDWSALRFRRVSKIKKITRNPDYALTQEAKKRTTKRKK